MRRPASWCVYGHIQSLPIPVCCPHMLQDGHHCSCTQECKGPQTMHTALSHLDKKNTYVRMLLIVYSSAFNTIVPSKLIIKLEALGLNPALCNWVLDFLTGRPQVVTVGNNISTSLILNTRAPQGCVLSPLLYSLFTHDCVAMHASNSIIKFVDDTTLVGLITNNDKTEYREELRILEVWHQENNLSLNVNKAKETIVDFRKQQTSGG
ncbi:uncharacterized protein ACWYII_020322 [Salvelinus alpinus]